jgi:hypothetical protein
VSIGAVRQRFCSTVITPTPGAGMATKLDKTLKRELDIAGEPYMLTIAPDGLKLVQKGRRKGYELAWKDLVSGEAALATALNASLEQARS